VKESSKKKPDGILERIKSTSFPPAAVAGALASFAGAAFGKQSMPQEKRKVNAALVQISPAQSKPASASAPMKLDVEFSQPSVLQVRLQHSLSGIAVGLADEIFVLGDGEVRIFDSSGQNVRKWKAINGASCIAVGEDLRVYLGAAGRVEIFDIEGHHRGGFGAGEPGKPAEITALKVLPNEILIADAAGKYIRRYSHDGKSLGKIGNRTKTGGFMLPNRSLDIDVDSKGTVIATDPGRHRVSFWLLDGTPVRHFGKFGLLNQEDFVGCCNPVNIALTGDGKIVTAEKVVPRIKVFSPVGKLLALIGPEYFDPKCTHIHLAIDSKGRILAADPVRLEVKIFSVVLKSGGRESA
jgi:hypothetical protein